MPELPEVETTVRGLRETVVRKTIARVRVTAPPNLTVVSESFGKRNLASIPKGKKILGVTRRGKNILISLTGRMTLWVHLKMTGHFSWVPVSDPVNKHDLVVIDFRSTLKPTRRSRHLRFNDYRRFGRLRLFPDDELRRQPGLSDLGPEPLEIKRDDFVSRCRGSRRMIKPALLDQTFLAGLGNIYADESLYCARIHPRRLTSSISSRKLGVLHGCVRNILKKAIRLMGTSVDSYEGVYGQPGSFQGYLKVYGNEGNPCQYCGREIVREKIGSRSAHYCPRCQRL